MLKVNHGEFRTLIKEYYKKKLALFCFGGFGIGKSYVVRDVAEELGKERGRKFIEWNKINDKDKQKVFEYPEEYFVLIDERLSEYDSSDIKGLPNFKDNKDTIEWKIPTWAKFLTLDNSDGIVFFDEINLATPLVISSVYKIIYDRVVNESKINNNWFIMGAGNREEDRAFTHTLPAPVRDRGGEIELVSPNIDDWTIWATQHSMDSRIIGFTNFKPSTIGGKIDFNDNQKFTTARGFERLSKLIKDVRDWDTFELICCSAIGEGIAREFVAFCKLQDKLKLDEIIKNPDKIEKIEDISVKYLLVSAIAEKYKDKKVDFDKIMEVSKVFDKVSNAEFVALLWRLCSHYTTEFKKDFVACKDSKLISRYAKFIVA